MSEKKLTPFKQLPYWEQDTTFTITTKEMEAIQSVSEAYSKFIPIMEGMLIRFLNEEKIKVRYEDLEGKELSKDEVIAMIKQMADEQTQQQSVEPDMS